MPSTEQYVTLQCISNLVGGDLVGTAKGPGAAGPGAGAGRRRPGAVQVVFHAVGGYWTRCRWPRPWTRPRWSPTA